MNVYFCVLASLINSYPREQDTRVQFVASYSNGRVVLTFLNDFSLSDKEPNVRENNNAMHCLSRGKKALEGKIKSL